MLGSVALEVIIGVIFTNILVATICATIREGIEARLKTRAAYLEHAIRELLHDTEGRDIATAFYQHPLIYSLFSGTYTPGKTGEPALLARGKNLPSYIPSANFAVALLDIAARGPATDTTSSDATSPIISLAAVRANIANIGNKHVQRALLTAIDTAQGDLNQAQLNIENWYNGSMDRVSGWYKRSTYWVIFWIGLVIAVGFNINTITIADYLYRNDAVRQVMVKRAEAAAADTSFLRNNNYETAKQQLDTLTVPIGWNVGWGAPRPGDAHLSAWNDFFGPIVGWLLTALAATLGAPFWFDLLNKIMVIRSTVKPHEKSPEEGSDDNGTSKKSLLPAGVPVNGNQRLPVADSNTSFHTGAAADHESDIDGCDVVTDQHTPDDALPPSEGGVA